MDLFPSKKKYPHRGFCRDKLALQVWSSSVPCWTSVDLQSGNALRTGFVPAAVKAVQEVVRNTYRPTWPNTDDHAWALWVWSTTWKNIQVDQEWLNGFLVSCHPLNCLDLWLAEVLALCVEWEWKLRQQATWHKDAGFACNFGHATRPVKWIQHKAYDLVGTMFLEINIESESKHIRQCFTVRLCCLSKHIRNSVKRRHAKKHLEKVLHNTMCHSVVSCLGCYWLAPRTGSVSYVWAYVTFIWVPCNFEIFAPKNSSPTHRSLVSMKFEVEELRIQNAWSFLPMFFSPKRCRSTTLQYLKLPGSHRRTLWSTWHVSCSSEACSIALLLCLPPSPKRHIFSPMVLSSTREIWKMHQIPGHTDKPLNHIGSTNPSTSHNIPF